MTTISAEKQSQIFDYKLNDDDDSEILRATVP